MTRRCIKPGIATGATYDRFLAAYAYTGGLNQNAVIVGIAKIGSGGGGWCQGGGGLFYFTVAYDQYGDNILGAPSCTSVPSGDINGNIQLQISVYVSNGGGMQAIIHRPNGQLVYTSYPFADGTPSAFYTNRWQEQVANQTFSGHYVWGVSWVHAQWEDGSLQWQYQTRDFDFRSDRNPPQFYWVSVPNNNNNGGNLYSCIYDTGTTCNFGS